MKKLILPLLTVTLSSCYLPKAIKSTNGDESTMDCRQIAYEIDAAKQAKEDAHKDDHFKITHMFNYVYVYKLWKADSAATKRIDLLTGLYNSKNCQNMQYNNNPYGMGNPYGNTQQYPNQYSAPQMQQQMPYQAYPPIQ